MTFVDGENGGLVITCSGRKQALQSGDVNPRCKLKGEISVLHRFLSLVALEDSFRVQAVFVFTLRTTVKEKKKKETK